ncbi:MSCRAMM family protein [Bacillus sp. FSL R9-9410]|uniref:MSCRAMM family protein n=1 Tax=Bacillus sp. FSL R9-9410 TaxID=2921590 RepID=UPI003100AA3B
MFQILNKDGKDVGKLTTDENCKATSEPLRFGKYTAKEIQAPNGYMLFRDPFEVEFLSSV